jgi:outer membrane lipoprotein-sorting protein
MNPHARIRNGAGMRVTMAAVVWTMICARGAAAESLEAVLARMDQAAPSFKGLAAQLRKVSHTAVINEDTTDTGNILLRRAHNDMRMLVEFTEPDPKSVAVHGDRVEIYYPKMQTVEEYDMGKNRALVDQFLLVGFGTSGKDLSAAYQIKLLGGEPIGGVNTTHLELIPKSKEVLKQLKKLELWLQEPGMYPVQQKITLSAGDYMLFTYTGVKLNAPHSDADLKLKAPKNAKHVTPQK